MKCRSIVLGLIAAWLMPLGMAFATHIIPDEQLNKQKIFEGNWKSFDNPASVKIEDVIKATPEYAKIKKEKLDRGDGKYWILISEATDRAIQAISDVADESDYDLIAVDGYLDNLEPPIASVDITKDVLKKLEE